MKSTFSYYPLKPNRRHHFALLQDAHSRAFTLVELLVVIAIIGILSAIVVGVLAGAQQDTLINKTRGTIAKIDSILNDRYQEYNSIAITYQPNLSSGSVIRTSKFPIERVSPIESIQRYEDTSYQIDTSRIGYDSQQVPPIGLLAERVRLGATRDLMRLEMPDCLGDLLISSGTPRGPVLFTTGHYQSISGSRYPIVMQIELPERANRIYNRLALVPAVNDWSANNANSELLYLVIEDSALNGASAMEAFGSSEIGDTDNDGLSEFIDAWGRPIRWLRWPAGYNDEISASYGLASNTPGFRNVQSFNPDPMSMSPAPSDAMDSSSADVGYDPVQAGSPLGAGSLQPGDALKPLVVSGGTDGRFGIRFQWQPSTVTGQGWATSNPEFFSSAAVRYTSSTWPRSPLYWSGSPFNWPDPYHPRFSNISGNSDMRESNLARLGGPLLINYDGANEILGVSLVSSSMVVDSIAVGSDAVYATHASDNVTNLDESGASL